MITISLCMIVKNEEEVLADCLSSVQDIVDEMIIVDTGSTDQTKEIAHSFSAKVLDFEWVQHFAKARNFAFSHATKEYVLWLDADDVLLEEDRQNCFSSSRHLIPRWMPFRCFIMWDSMKTVRLISNIEEIAL